MLKILIAPDKFKGSLTAKEVCEAVEEGLLQRKKEYKITSVPLADGGEGTCEILTHFFEGTMRTVEVSGPLFTPIKAEYGISKDGRTAFIEMAKASGLQLLEPKKRNPLYTTTLGTGELIKDALHEGVTKIILGVGGSATNDAGIGMASALGFEFFDAKGNPLKPVGENLNFIESIGKDKINPRLGEVEFITLCDVDNPLHGVNGAAFVYGPQKGADPQAVTVLDSGLHHFEKIVQAFFSISANFPGSGAAGGLGAGSKIFLGASLTKGITYIISATDLVKKIEDSDLIITGEGKLDHQSLFGKVVIEVSSLARRFNKPLLAICGKCELSADALQNAGIGQVISLTSDAVSAEESMARAYALIRDGIACHRGI